MKRTELKRSDIGAWKYRNGPDWTLKGIRPDFKTGQKSGNGCKPYSKTGESTNSGQSMSSCFFKRF